MSDRDDILRRADELRERIAKRQAENPQPEPRPLAEEDLEAIEQAPEVADVPALLAEVRRLRAQAKADMDTDDKRHQDLYWSVVNALKAAETPVAKEVVEGVQWLQRERDEARAKLTEINRLVELAQHDSSHAAPSFQALTIHLVGKVLKS